MRRHLLGIIGLALLASGVVGVFCYGVNDSQGSLAASMGLRAGLTLCAVWLAFPQLVQLLSHWPVWLIGALVLSLLVAVRYPRALFLVLPLVGVIVLLQFVGWVFKPLPKKSAPRSPGDRARGG